MISDELAKQLHDKSTRGKSLSLEEQGLLEQWYAFQDQAETQTLAKSYDETRLFMLQTQVNTALSQLMTVTKQIQQVIAENEALKGDIIQLHNQLVQQTTLSLAK
jgi:hypothetical protein